MRVKPEWALKVLKHYQSQWTEIEKIVNIKCCSSCSSTRFLIFIIVHLCNPLHFPEMLCRWSKAGLWWQPRGRGFWNAFCFQLTEEDKIQQSTFPMSRYFREGQANIFVPFYNGTKNSCYLLFSCWQTWNLPNSQTFLFLQKKNAEEGRFTEECFTLLTRLILFYWITYAFGNVSTSRPGDQVG